MGHNFNLKGWPNDTTTCEVCGEQIIYLRHLDPPEAKPRRKRPVPRWHNGDCRQRARVRLAQKKVRKYGRRKARARKGSSNGNTVGTIQTV